MRKLIDQYFGLIALALIGLSGLAGAVIRRSLFAGAVWAALAVGAVILYFIWLGLYGAAAERLRELKAGASTRGSSLAKELAKAWAWGLVLWIPPEAFRTQFLMVWAAVGTAAALLLPKLQGMSSPARLGLLAALVGAAGFINAAFHRGEP